MLADTPILTVQNLSKKITDRSILAEVSFSVARGEVLCVIGPSGAGKTTLLRCLNLLTVPDEGRICLAGETIFESSEGRSTEFRHPSPNTVRRRIGLVFQEWNLWPNMTVRDNVAEGLRVVLKLGKHSAFKKAVGACEQVGLGEMLTKYPHQLSGGEKQRAALARALVMEPEVLMLDEITSALDPTLVSEILEILAGLKSSERAIVIVTHHLNFARSVADNVAFIHNGRVLEYGRATEILDSPKCPELSHFLITLTQTR